MMGTSHAGQQEKASGYQQISNRAGPPAPGGACPGQSRERRAGRQHGASGLGQMVSHTVSSAFLVPASELQAPTRCRANVAKARQVAMYLAHVGLGLSYTDAGRLFGRDRTTVAHACRLVEERREDPRFDASLDYLEQTLRARLFGTLEAVSA